MPGGFLRSNISEALRKQEGEQDCECMRSGNRRDRPRAAIRGAINVLHCAPPFLPFAASAKFGDRRIHTMRTFEPFAAAAKSQGSRAPHLELGWEGNLRCASDECPLNGRCHPLQRLTSHFSFQETYVEQI